LPGSGQELNLAVQRSKDLESLSVDMELFAMPHFNQMRPVFDIKKFYANIITFDEDDYANGMLDVNGA
jgi:ATP-dependent DNA helicase 2 subunit 1